MIRQVQLSGPDRDTLRAKLTPTELDLWRVRSPTHADPYDDTGSRLIRRGRHHVPHLFGALYYATSFDGALLEFASRQEARPLTAVVHHHRVRIPLTLDLTDVDVRRALTPWDRDPLSVDALTLRNSFTLSNGVAAVALGLGADGVIAPSAAYHRDALSGTGVRYRADGVGVEQGAIDEFQVVAVLRSAVCRELRPPIHVDGLDFWSAP